MLQQLSGRPPLFRVFDKADADEIPEFFAPARPYGRRLLIQNVEDDLVLGLTDVGCVSIGHLHREDAQTPNVDLGRVPAFSLYQLWGHPAHGADLGGARLDLLGELARVPKVGQLDVALNVHEQVVAFDVSVDDVALVQVGEGLCAFAEDVLADVL